MKIYSMTATFGKLEHETLTLKPGLNIIEAPNEWGKSTWCAFLVNMLYGLDTGARSTKTALADKERYAPWSGSPMSGRIELSWNGRDITIERSTRGRLIFGEFRAYETATGIDIPELNGANCGQQLLGVERPVFTRAGFLKLTDLPVTQNDALRRRLNNLVTTGDESGAGDKLSDTLKDLRNKCRYNRSGLLPQSENQREQLRHQLEQLHDLQTESTRLERRQAELEQHIHALENHRQALAFAAAAENTQKLAEAEEAATSAQAALEEISEQIAALPSSAEAQQAKKQGQELQQTLLSLQMEEAMLPPLPQSPVAAPCYQNMDPEAAVEKAKNDFATLGKLESGKSSSRTVLLLGIPLICAGIVLAVLGIIKLINALIAFPAGGCLFIAGLLMIILGSSKAAKARNAIRSLYGDHPGLTPDRWIADAEDHAKCQAEYHRQLQKVQALRGDLDQRKQQLRQAISDFTAEGDLAQQLQEWDRVSQLHDRHSQLQREHTQAQSYAQAMRQMAQPVEPPQEPDSLTVSAFETEAQLQTAQFELRQLHRKLGQCNGLAESLGQESLLRSRLDTLNRKIARLEDTYYALEMAQDALREATTTLQRRFAPRISKRAQGLFGAMTQGRYQRLALGEDLSLSISAENEDTLRSSQWRSDGTVDQLYLALRLAVAEELTPDAPLVLDDALVRFDDDRLKQALQILKETAENKQVILFTCQGRESALEGE